MAEKNYIKGFAKERKFDNGGSIIALTLNLEQLSQLPLDNYGNIKIDVCQKRETDQWGNTHYVVENTFVPNGWGSSAPTGGSKAPAEEEDMPF